MLVDRHRYLQTTGDGILKDLEGVEVYIAFELVSASLPIEYCAVAADAGHNQVVLTDEAIRNYFREIIATCHGANVRIGANNVQTDGLSLIQIQAFYGEKEQADHRGQAALAEAMMLLICSSSKTGSATREWVRSRARQLGAGAGIDVSWSQRDISQFWDRFGSKIAMNMAGWATFFQGVIANCGENLRLRITAEQAQYAGMTGLQWVLSASNQTQDFPWQRLAEAVGENNRIMEAAKQARGHPYAMFSSDPNEKNRINGAYYPNLVYAAQQVLLQICGEQSVAGYQGIRTCRHKMLIDKWISEYKQGVALPDFPGLVANAAPFGANL
jgi:hypothetical protein